MTAADPRGVRLDDLAEHLTDVGLTGVHVEGDRTVSVTDTSHDSRAVEPGSLFVCVPGAVTDGHRYAAAAVAAGAVALLVQRDHVAALADDVAANVPRIVVDDSRRAHGHAAAFVHGHPARSLLLVGVTGTNGKTTTAHLLGAALRGAGRTVEVLGTLSGARTTPEASELQRQLVGLRERGVDTVVMEVSSHALALHRVDGCRFDAAVFTNLGRDHLDLHATVEEYFRAKARLFTPELSERGVVNTDDTSGRLIADVGAIPIHPYGRADAEDVEAGPAHHRFRWRGRAVEVPIGGDVNVANSLAALTTCDALGIDVDAAVRGLAAADPVPGRFELVGADLGHGFAVVVDYAHTPDGLATLLASARRLTSASGASGTDGAAASAGGRGRVVLVFGCGGDRDRDKRGMMGAAAAEGADAVVVTSDNPRTEDPAAIIADVLSGIDARYRDRVVVDADRRSAIGTAIRAARPGDVVVIAGKGHETTQTIGTTAHPFDDRVVAREHLEALS